MVGYDGINIGLEFPNADVSIGLDSDISGLTNYYDKTTTNTILTTNYFDKFQVDALLYNHYLKHETYSKTQTSNKTKTQLFLW